MRTMCTYMDRCRCAVVIWLWHKFFRLWGKLCAMRWGKIIGCGVSYHPLWRKLPPVLVPSDSFPGWYSCFLGWNSAKALCCCSHLNAAARKFWYVSPLVWCRQNVLTVSGSDFNNTATMSASATCSPVASIELGKVPKSLLACILVVNLPDRIRHNSAGACLTGMQTETLVG